MSLTGIGKIYNGVKFDFPLKECITSVLEAADEFVLVVCEDSEDDTVDYCEHLSQEIDGLRLLKDVWRQSETENYTNMTRLANKAIDAAKTEWIWSIDMDEILPAGEGVKMKNALASVGIGIGCFLLNFNHLYYDLDHKILGKLYDQMHRVARRRRNWRSGLDGCGLGGGSGLVKALPVVMNHYGYLREVAVAVEKETRFQQELYHEGVPGLPDSRLVEFGTTPPKTKEEFWAAFVSPDDTVVDYDGPAHHPLAIAKYGVDNV